jgi:peroxiredoxin
MKNIFYFFVISILIASCSSKTQYVVKGKIEGSDKIVFYLQKRDAGKIVNIDSAVSKKGSFTLKGGSVAYPQLVQLVAGGTKKRTSFYLENSVITIEGTIDSLFKAEIQGSKTQDEYKTLIESNKSLSDVYSKTISDFRVASQSGNTSKQAEIEKSLDSIQSEMLKNQKDFILKNPSSYVTPSILGGISYDMEADELEAIINKLDTAIAALPQIVFIKERIAVMKTVAIGQKAPDFTMNDVDGNPVSLSSKIGSKLLLIDFWAAWCGPCREENPNVVKIYNEFNKKGFNIVGVSLDNRKEDWVKAIADDKLTWTHVSDLQRGNNAAAKLYAVNVIPSNFLLDENGVIIGRNLRGGDLYNKVKEILGSK